jgi:hypothetical protein
MVRSQFIQLWAHVAARASARVILLLCLIAAGCRRDEIVDGVTDSGFVAAMAELRRIQMDQALDSVRRDSARQLALQRRGLTLEQLEAAASVLSEEPKRATALFRAIELRIASPVGQSTSDSTPRNVTP